MYGQLLVQMIGNRLFSPWMQTDRAAVLHGIPRTVALGLILVVLVAGIVGLGALVIPALVTQIEVLATSAPTMQGQVADYLASTPFLAWIPRCGSGRVFVKPKGGR